MKRLHASLIVPIASVLAFGGLTFGTTSQSGPLSIGLDEESDTASPLCSPLQEPGAVVNFAAIITNETGKPARLQSVELVDPVNVRPGHPQAWNFRDSGPQLYWSEEQSAGDKSYERLASAMVPATGYVVEPGAGAGVSVPAEVAETRTYATVARILIRYTMNGRQYAELSGISYELVPGGCGP